LFWQTVFSIVLGVAAGLAILSFSHRSSAEALVNSTFPQLAGTKRNTIQIFPQLSERMTVLVMGVDSNGRDAQRFTGTRSDTMIVVNLDPQEHRVGIVSIPRDSRVQLSENHGTDKINAAHALGGAELATKTISENWGVPIDHFVVVDTQALKELCQLLGPVEVLVEKEMHYHDWAAHLHIDLKPGAQVLSPEQVEQYVRFRHDPRGDIGRIERQQWFFRAAAKKLKDPQFLLRLPDLIRMAHEYVQTDLSLEDMARIATFAKDIKPETVVTATLPGEAQMINGASYWVPDMDASRIVFHRILGLTASGGALVQDGSPTTATAVDGDRSNVELVVDNGAYNKPISVALKYPKECAEQADLLETLLSQQGYRVRYKWLMPAVDCQHEQIVQLSGRADDYATSKMRAQVPDLGQWPVVLELQPHPLADFAIVLSPNAVLSTSVVKPAAAINTVVRPIVPN
jgi:polyisoprenyl-teichoic acid--peptidoglycan teichoic acid transferase